MSFKGLPEGFETIREKRDVSKAPEAHFESSICGGIFEETEFIEKLFTRTNDADNPTLETCRADLIKVKLIRFRNPPPTKTHVVVVVLVIMKKHESKAKFSEP